MVLSCIFKLWRTENYDYPENEIFQTINDLIAVFFKYCTEYDKNDHQFGWLLALYDHH